VQRIHVRVLRALRKAGKWVDEDAAADADGAPADDLLPGLAAAAVAGRAAFGARAGRQAERRARARLRAPHRGGQSRSRRRRLPWADLLRRVFGIDVLVCPQCAGPRRVLAAIHDPAAIARVLGALGLTAAGADPAGCRAPPAAAGFDDADEGNSAE
jgi:hypothetical protein